MKTKNIAIIGGGPAGLVAAKEMRAQGLNPTVFERRQAWGGVWNRREGFAWPAMRTNLSRYSCVFSDFDWRPDAPLFPTSLDVAEYLDAYAAHFELRENFRFDSRVTTVKPDADGWVVMSVTEEWDEGEHYDGLVVASGVFSRPYTPFLPGLREEKNFVTHAADYRGPEKYRGRHVAVAGSSFTGFEIAADLAAHGAEVTHIVSTPPWVVPRLLPAGGVPLDLAFFTRAAGKDQPSDPAERNRQSNRYLAAIAAEFWGAAQGLCAPALHREADAATPPYIVISDDYVAQTQAGRIKPVRASVTGVTPRREIALGAASPLAADTLILCTGYLPDMAYLRHDILKQTGYNGSDQFLAMPLDAATLSAAMPNAAFVGYHRGPYFSTMELQARYAAALFAGRAPWPAQETIHQGVAVSRELRQQNPRPQFPYGDYVGLADELARRIGALPSPEENPRWASVFSHGPLIPAQYRFHDSATRAAAEDRMNAQLNLFRNQGWLTPEVLVP